MTTETPRFINEGEVFDQRREKTREISRSINIVLAELQVKDALEQVKAEWGEGGIKGVSYEESRFPDSQFMLNPHLARMRIGMTLETKVPFVDATYRQPIRGYRHYQPVECMPGHSHDDGVAPIYDNAWELDSVKVHSDLTSIDVLVQPVWKEYERIGSQGELTDPERYIVIVGNNALPNGREQLTAEDIINERTSNELVEEFLHNHGKRISFGVTEPTFVKIDTISPILKRRFDTALEMIVDQRKNAKGNPTNFRDYTAKLLEGLPKEFRDKQFAYGYELRNMINPQTTPLI